MDGGAQSTGQIGAEVLRRSTAPLASWIVETIRNERAPLRSLEAAIKAAPVFATRLVLLANLAKGAAPRVTGVSHAISVLGLENLKPLLLGLLAHEAQPAGGAPAQSAFAPDPTTCRDLWEHALACAMIAAKLGATLADISPLQAFIGGLIHDIGRVLLWHYSNAGFATASALVRAQQLPMWQAEQRTFGIDHGAIGEAWCGNCDIAAPLSVAVRWHHEPAPQPSGADRLIAIIQAAESLAEKTPPGLVDEGLPEDAAAWSALGLGEKAPWLETAQAVRSEIESLREAFGFPRFDRVKPAFYQREIALAPSDVAAATTGSAVAERGRVIPFPISAETARRLQSHVLAEKLSLLVVEDHGSLCDMVRMFLTRYGYQVRTASNGAIALDILAQAEIHMVLLDLMLPQVDGFEVLRQVHKSRQEMLPYIIVVSAGASDRDRKKVLDLGANEYMAKPFHLARLLERVQAVEKYLL